MSNIVPSPNILSFFYDQEGKPLAGGKLYTYIAGTTTPKDTYTDSLADFVNTNPIILDANGGCTVFIDTSEAYNFVLYDRYNNLIKSASNIFPFQGLQGPQGPMGSNGTKSDMWRSTGIYSFTVPANVTSIDYQLGGGGGGFYLTGTLPNIGSVATGTAGNIKSGTINVNPGDIIAINIGAGGQVSTIENNADGKFSQISSPTSLFANIVANGGTSGNMQNLSTNKSYFQKLPPFMNFKTFENKIISVVPNAIFGESTQFGEGGNIYKNGTPDAQGNCSSGGTNIPYIISEIANGISSLGKGSDGICVLTYAIN